MYSICMLVPFVLTTFLSQPPEFSISIVYLGCASVLLQLQALVFDRNEIFLDPKNVVPITEPKMRGIPNFNRLGLLRKGTRHVPEYPFFSKDSVSQSLHS